MEEGIDKAKGLNEIYQYEQLIIKYDKILIEQYSCYLNQLTLVRPKQFASKRLQNVHYETTMELPLCQDFLEQSDYKILTYWTVAATNPPIWLARDKRH